MKPLLLPLIATLCFTACQQENQSDILATIGPEKIRTADLQAEIARRQAAKRPIPALADLLTEMVEYQSLLQAAQKAGLDQQPDIQRTYHNLLIGSLKDNQLRPLLDAATVTDEEIESYYQSNQENYRIPERANIAIIFAASAAHESPARRQQAQQRIAEAKTLATADADGFKRTAAKFSDDQSSRYKGGDLGWLKAGAPHSRVPQPVIDTALTLAPDAVSDIIETDSGYYIAKLIAREPATHTPLEKVRPAITAQLLKQKRATITTDFQATIKTQAGVTTFPDRLDQIQLPPTPTNQDPTPPQL